MFKSSHRIYIDSTKHATYQQLVKRGNEKPDDFPFATMKDLFMLAVSIGRKNNAYLELQSPQEIFAGDVFDTKTDVAVLVAIAFSHEKEFDNLLDSKKIIEIAQAYANGGINHIEEQLLKQSGRPLNNLIDLIMV